MFCFQVIYKLGYTSGCPSHTFLLLWKFYYVFVTFEPSMETCSGILSLKKKKIHNKNHGMEFNFVNYNLICVCLLALSLSVS